MSHIPGVLFFWKDPERPIDMTLLQSDQSKSFVLLSDSAVINTHSQQRPCEQFYTGSCDELITCVLLIHNLGKNIFELVHMVLHYSMNNLELILVTKIRTYKQSVMVDFLG
ncbi:hypothetical protein PHYBLDRAFT_64914 [Phycomyces blakesleeanus NRRL 1555(-)]|uniref:Uncharacterized protein n=1 Tax=Phycomyces blakesleeanus (strain ATCC 8743b / DSM 1359 / FGSC 10004 / NBRC 33097 / NRRL 1555) TaxID=763407 RepID=A0A162UBZ6_PHYB8|nr:hypothetical protein PHYBLDRAFT_64914 [Phycomyces blakesleeanus NRRL 1555(-)]OAD73963.1 hypothetical protein PHYBLDRAFT_64914 [Phycomyces blakesleeanus NRRL 1555(-)]|eukprot:XP_018292003.1 hypothetical protein PHYBLDRAFT_64914 [Phycomyces blakesleeanus NRRL 1555(-)]